MQPPPPPPPPPLPPPPPPPPHARRGGGETQRRAHLTSRTTVPFFSGRRYLRLGLVVLGIRCGMCRSIARLTSAASVPFGVPLSSMHFSMRFTRSSSCSSR